jgi:hypothetical protein
VKQGLLVVQVQPGLLARQGLQAELGPLVKQVLQAKLGLRVTRALPETPARQEILASLVLLEKLGLRVLLEQMALLV